MSAALELADLQEHHYGRTTPIAAELRRQHSRIAELEAALDVANAEIKELKKVRK